MRRLPLALIGCLCLPALAVAADGPVEWLARMTHAVHSLEYEGVVVFRFDRQMNAMQLVHRVKDGLEQERLFSLNGPRKEVVRDAQSVICIQPDRRQVSVGPRAAAQGFSSFFSRRPEELSGVYEFHMEGRDRVAGREVQIVTIAPKDEYRYGYRLYLDLDSALPLKTETLDAQGQALAETLFTSLALGVSGAIDQGSDDQLLAPEYAWVHEGPALPTPVAESRWEVGNLPQGFESRTHVLRPARDNHPAVEQFVFSDGVASLSVYLEPDGGPDWDEGGVQMGAVHMYGHRVSGHRVTVVGETPANTVRWVAEGVRARSTP